MGELNSTLDTDEKKIQIPRDRFLWRHNGQRNIKNNLKEEQVRGLALPNNKIYLIKQYFIAIGIE